MKVLHIGKHGNMERFSNPDSFLNQVEIIDMPVGLTDDQYLLSASDVDFMVVDAIAPVSEYLISNMPNLKLIHSEGVAFNKIDVNAAMFKGIMVCNSKGMNSKAVAEHTILLMNSMLHNIIVNDKAVREGKQIVTKESYMVNANLLELADCSVGLVGFGDIAKDVSLLLGAYGVKKIYCTDSNPVAEEEAQYYNVNCVSIDELLTNSNIVSLHIPVTDSSYHFADNAFFDKMKDRSYFVNTARGELVDDIALIKALQTGKLAMAALDTLSNEPVSENHPLINPSNEISDKIIFSPHIAGITSSSFRRSYEIIWEDIQAVAEGNIPKHLVN